MDEQRATDEQSLPNAALHPLLRLATKLRRRLRTVYLPRLLGSKDQLYDRLHEIPRRMQKLTNQVELVLELARDYQEGRYRELRWYSLAVAVVCILYFISPADMIPDAIPALGALDDLFVLGLATRLLRHELVAYCEHKGYDASRYF